VVPAHTWQRLAAATLRRQFPAIADVSRGGLTDLFGRIGPIQSQAARAPFLTASSRLPGVTNATVSAAYEDLDIVRSTSLRGTVHTSPRGDHSALDAVARRTSMNLWCRTLKLSADDVTRLRSRIEDFTADDWLPHAALHDRVLRWLASEGCDEAIAASRDGVGFALYRGHSALLRRPLTGGWHQQGTYGYRTAALLLGDPAVDPDEALTRLVRIHLSAFGPATRHDIAWWTGDGLRRVDAAITRLGDELVAGPGPDGHDYLDVADPPASGAGDPGVRLLPEYDALLLGYAPAGRVKFADPRAISFSLNRANGVHAPTVLAEGRVRGTWRLQTARQSTRLLVSMVPGERRLREEDLAGQAIAVGQVLGVSVDGVEVVTTPPG
jgi:Winged helix DNA-binding domain